MKLRLLTGILFVSALWIAGCGGGSAPIVPAPATSFSPLPAASATAQATLVSTGTTVALPAVAGVTGTLTLPPIAGLAGNTPVTLTVSTRPTAGIGAPNVPTLLYVSFPLPAGAALTGPPSLNLTLPSIYAGPFQTALIGQYAIGNGNGNPLVLSGRSRRVATTNSPPNLVTLFSFSQTGPTSSPTPTPEPNHTPAPTPIPWQITPVSQDVVLGAVSISYTIPSSTPTYHPGAVNFWLNSGQSAQFTLVQSSQWILSPSISLSSTATLCENPYESFGSMLEDPSSLSTSITTTSSTLETATYSISESLSANDTIYTQLSGAARCLVMLDDIPNKLALFTTLLDAGPVATPTPTPTATPDASAATSVTLYTGMNDINSAGGDIPVPAQGFTNADLSLPGVSSQVSGTLNVSVGRTNFAPTVFPATLPGTPLEFVSVSFTQPFSFVSSTAAGLTSDLCFPSSSITAASYTFTYYAKGTKIGSAPATIATNDGTCTNTHLSASSTPLGSLPANSTGFGLLVSSP